jgi:hypothetical protein
VCFWCTVSLCLVLRIPTRVVHLHCCFSVFFSVFFFCPLVAFSCALENVHAHIRSAFSCAAEHFPSHTHTHTVYTHAKYRQGESSDVRRSTFIIPRSHSILICLVSPQTSISVCVQPLSQERDYVNGKHNAVCISRGPGQ